MAPRCAPLSKRTMVCLAIVPMTAGGERVKGGGGDAWGEPGEGRGQGGRTLRGMQPCIREGSKHMSFDWEGGTSHAWILA